MNQLLACMLFATCWCAAIGSDIPPPRPVNVAAIVRQLGSDEFAEREAATRRLSTLSVDEVPLELLAALKSESPEVRERAAKAIKALREHIVLARLPRAERFAKRGQIDLYVASTAATKLKADDDRLWLPAFEIGVTTAEKAGLKGDRLPQGPAWVKHFPAYRKNLLNDTLIRMDGVFTRRKTDYFIFYGAIVAAGVDEPQSIEGLIMSRGTVCVRKNLNNSLVLATGDLDVGESMHKSAVICDGDVVVGGMGGCFVIARGNITVDGSGYENTLIAGGTVTFKKPVQLPNQQTLPKGSEDLITEKNTKPLGYITFFELSTVGVEVKVADKAIQITAVTDDKPFAASGVKVGDVIIEVNGKKPDSPESLRRLLRDALAIGDATVKLQRGDKTETVKVVLPE